MTRGEIWTVAGAGHAGKPRPAVVVQEDSFDGTDSVTICVLTTDPTEAPIFRLRVDPDQRNGLQSTSRIMVDKVTTVPRTRMGRRIGRLGEEEIVRLNRALMVFLGLAA